MPMIGTNPLWHLLTCRQLIGVASIIPTLGIMLGSLLLGGCSSVETTQGSGNVVTETRSLGDFSTIEMDLPARLEIVDGPEAQLRISAEDNLLPLLTSHIEDGELTLSASGSGRVQPTEPIRLILTAPAVDTMMLNGAGEIVVDTWPASRTTVVNAGAGRIIFGEIDGEDLNVLITGDGSVEINGGRVTTLVASISGDGSLLAAGVQSESGRVNVGGLGTAEVWVRDQLEATITGGGAIRYAGRPQVTRRITGLGQIEALDEGS